MNVTDTGARNDCVTVLFIVMLLGLPGKGTHGGREGGFAVGKTNWQAQAGWRFPFVHNTARIMTTTTSRLDVNMQSVL